MKSDMRMSAQQFVDTCASLLNVKIYLSSKCTIHESFSH